MGTVISGSPLTIPDLVSEARKLRRDLDANVSTLRSILERSKAVARDTGWSAERSPGNQFRTAEAATLDRLTPREREVLRFIAEGKSSKAIADLLGMAFRTAVCHRYRIFKKLQVHDLASVVRLAVRAGLVDA